MGKMPYTDWKERATCRSEWIYENAENAFMKFIEKKWKDACNVATAKPGSWETSGNMAEKMPAEGATSLARRATAAPGSSLPWMPQQEGEGVGCSEEHAAATCSAFRGLQLEAKKKALLDFGLCTFCLRHPVETGCFGKGTVSKPACKVLECK